MSAFGTGLVCLAADAWLDGHAGPIHIAMALLGLGVLFSDLIFAPAPRWRQMFAPRPWSEAFVFGGLVCAIVFVGQYLGL